ncbi:MAG: PIG-L deacetylase family protein [Pirellulales bacterium]
MLRTQLVVCGWFLIALVVGSGAPLAHSAHAADPDGKLRILCFGAHPDDAEYKAGGVAAKWARLGHHVKFVSVTNGDIGHWQIAGGPLAQRRTAEVRQVAKVLGIVSEVLDIHDGELLPTLENRRLITRLIRNWKADVVISHRPNDYHPDHRYTGVLVQDAAFMVTVPFFCPDTPALAANPVFLYYSDNFQRPNPFTPDVAVSIDDVFDKKIDAVDQMPSQVYEGGASGSDEFVRPIPKDPVGRRTWAIENHGRRYAAVADKYRDALVKWYGPKRGADVHYAEAFEVCEYGRRPSEGELAKLFPFFDE